MARAELAVPFTPKKLLVTYDPAGGLCARVVPEMVKMLEDRAFVVEVQPIAAGELSVEDYHGVVLGTPVGLRGGGASEPALGWVGRAQGIEEKKVAVFSAFWLREGGAAAQLRRKVEETGAEVVVDYGYWLVRPADGKQVLPAECMVRIR